MKGFTAVRDAADDIEARKAAGGGGGKLFFKVEDGSTETVRFLEQGDDITSAWVHELPKEKGQNYGRKVPCRDQDPDTGQRIGEDCPGCENEYKRTFQGVINVIWRNAPVYERDENDKLVKGDDNKLVVVGKADQVALWTAGITLFGEVLHPLDAKYKGLSSRDFDVTRRGSGLSTSYNVLPNDVDAGPQKLSAADLELASDKFDLSSYIEAPEYDKWGKKQQRKQEERETTPAAESPFARNK